MLSDSPTSKRRCCSRWNTSRYYWSHDDDGDDDDADDSDDDDSDDDDGADEDISKEVSFTDL